MSIKTNTISLQNLLDAVNALPEASNSENLDVEISTQATLLSEQDAKIAELAEILASKASGGSGDGYAEIDGLITGEISNYTNSRVSYIASGFFAMAVPKLKEVSFPACTSIAWYAFYDAYIQSISFPVCTTIGQSAFYNCNKLTTVSFPACTTISSYAFQRCWDLTTASFPVCANIGNSAFCTCGHMSQLYLATPKVCQLSNSNAFDATPYAGNNYHFSGTPYIYVPSSLVDVYKTATNWAYFSSYFSAYDFNDGENDNIFYLNGIQYQAEEGMTFSDWVSSEYNIDGWRIMGPYLAYPDRTPYTTVKSTDIIEFGCSY